MLSLATVLKEGLENQNF